MRRFRSPGLGWGLRVRISNKHSGDAAAGRLKTALRGALVRNVTVVGRRLAKKSFQKKQPKYSCGPFCSARGDTLEWQVHSGVCRLAARSEWGCG